MCGSQAKELIAHKMYLTYQPLLLYCLKDRLDRKTYKSTEKSDILDLEFYRNLPAVIYRKLFLEGSENEICNLLK